MKVNISRVLHIVINVTVGSDSEIQFLIQIHQSNQPFSINWLICVIVLEPNKRRWNSVCEFRQYCLYFSAADLAWNYQYLAEETDELSVEYFESPKSPGICLITLGWINWTGVGQRPIPCGTSGRKLRKELGPLPHNLLCWSALPVKEQTSIVHSLSSSTTL